MIQWRSMVNPKIQAIGFISKLIRNAVTLSFRAEIEAIGVISGYKTRELG